MPATLPRAVQDQLNDMRKYIRKGLEKWAADNSESDDDKTFESSFSQLAHTYLQQKAPSLLDFELGFQLIDKAEDDSKALGITGFKVGPMQLLAPVFFLDGDLKGQELLYIKEQNLYVPLMEEWLNYLLNRRPHKIGGGVTRNLKELGVLPGSIYQFKYPPTKWASAKEAIAAGLFGDKTSTIERTANGDISLRDDSGMTVIVKKADDMGFARPIGSAPGVARPAAPAGVAKLNGPIGTQPPAGHANDASVGQTRGFTGPIGAQLPPTMTQMGSAHNRPPAPEIPPYPRGDDLPLVGQNAMERAQIAERDAKMTRYLQAHDANDVYKLPVGEVHGSGLGSVKPTPFSPNSTSDYLRGGTATSIPPAAQPGMAKGGKVTPDSAETEENSVSKHKEPCTKRYCKGCQTHVTPTAESKCPACGGELSHCHDQHDLSTTEWEQFGVAPDGVKSALEQIAKLATPIPAEIAPQAPNPGVARGPGTNVVGSPPVGVVHGARDADPKWDRFPRGADTAGAAHPVFKGILQPQAPRMGEPGAPKEGQLSTRVDKQADVFPGQAPDRAIPPKAAPPLPAHHLHGVSKAIGQPGLDEQAAGPGELKLTGPLPGQRLAGDHAGMDHSPASLPVDPLGTTHGLSSPVSPADIGAEHPAANPFLAGQQHPLGVLGEAHNAKSPGNSWFSLGSGGAGEAKPMPANPGGAGELSHETLPMPTEAAPEGNNEALMTALKIIGGLGAAGAGAYGVHKLFSRKKKEKETEEKEARLGKDAPDMPDWAYDFLKPFAQAVTMEWEKTASLPGKNEWLPDLPTFLKEGGIPACASFLSLVSDYPIFMDGVDKFYGRDKIAAVIQEVQQEAEAAHTGLPLPTKAPSQMVSPRLEGSTQVADAPGDMSIPGSDEKKGGDYGVAKPQPTNLRAAGIADSDDPMTQAGAAKPEPQSAGPFGAAKGPGSTSVKPGLAHPVVAPGLPKGVAGLGKQADGLVPAIFNRTAEGLKGNVAPVQGQQAPPQQQHMPAPVGTAATPFQNLFNRHFDQAATQGAAAAQEQIQNAIPGQLHSSIDTVAPSHPSEFKPSLNPSASSGGLHPTPAGQSWMPPMPGTQGMAKPSPLGAPGAGSIKPMPKIGGMISIIRMRSMDNDLSPLFGKDKQLEEGEKEKMMKGEVVIRDLRPNTAITKAYEVQDHNYFKFFNPTETGLYEVLVQPGEFARCAIFDAPWSGHGMSNGKLVIRLDNKTWLHTHGSQILCRKQELYQEFLKWFQDLPEADDLDNELYAIVSPSGNQSTVPCVSRKHSANGKFKVYKTHFMREPEKKRELDVRDAIPTPPDELLWDRWHYEGGHDGQDHGHNHGLYPTGQDKIILTGRPGKGFRLVGGEMLVPSGSRYVDLSRHESCGCGHDSEPAPILTLATMADLQLQIHKHAGKPLEIVKSGSYYEFDGQNRLDREEAVIYLVQDLGLREKAARALLSSVTAKDKKVIFLKQAEGEGPEYSHLNHYVAGAPGHPEPTYMEQPTLDNTVPGHTPEPYQQVVPGMGADLTDYNVYDPRWIRFPYPSLGDVRGESQRAEAASEKGQKEIFDTSMMSAVIKNIRPETIITQQLGPMTQTMSRYGKLLMNLYWNKQDWEERYGKDELPALEDLIKDVFENTGKLILGLKEDDASPRFHQSVLPDIRKGQEESEANVD